MTLPEMCHTTIIDKTQIDRWQDDFNGDPQQDQPTARDPNCPVNCVNFSLQKNSAPFR